MRGILDAVLRSIKRGDSDECIPWPGGLQNDGYGRAWVGNNRRRVAHRVVWERLYGPVDDHLQLDHLCRNRRCVNPLHLEPVTPRQNSQRAQATEQVCKNGHPRNEENIHVRRNGRYACRPCDVLRQRAYQNRKRNRVSA